MLLISAKKMRLRCDDSDYKGRGIITMKLRFLFLCEAGDDGVGDFFFVKKRLFYSE